MEAISNAYALHVIVPRSVRTPLIPRLPPWPPAPPASAQSRVGAHTCTHSAPAATKAAHIQAVGTHRAINAQSRNFASHTDHNGVVQTRDGKHSDHGDQSIEAVDGVDRTEHLALDGCSPQCLWMNSLGHSVDVWTLSRSYAFK